MVYPFRWWNEIIYRVFRLTLLGIYAISTTLALVQVLLIPCVGGMRPIVSGHVHYRQRQDRCSPQGCSLLVSFQLPSLAQPFGDKD